MLRLDLHCVLSFLLDNQLFFAQVCCAPSAVASFLLLVFYLFFFYILFNVIFLDLHIVLSLKQE